MANDTQAQATSAAPVLQPPPTQTSSSPQSAQPAQSPAPSNDAPVLSPMSVGGSDSGSDSGTASDRAGSTSELLNNAATQAKGFVPGLVNGSLVAVHNGGVGDKGAVNVYRTDDLKNTILRDPIQYSVYDGSTDPDGNPIASKRVLTPDGKVSMYDYYLKQTEATKQLLQISSQHQAEQASDALNQAKKEVLKKSVEYDFAKSLDKDGNPVYEHRTIDADGKNTKYDAFVATERAERQLVNLQGKYEAEQKARKAGADVGETQQRTATLAEQEKAAKQEVGIKGHEEAEKQTNRQVQKDWDAAIKESDGDPAKAAAIMKQKSPDSWARMAGNEALAQQKEGTTVTTTDPLTGEKVVGKSQPRLFTKPGTAAAPPVDTSSSVYQQALAIAKQHPEAIDNSKFSAEMKAQLKKDLAGQPSASTNNPVSIVLSDGTILQQPPDAVAATLRSNKGSKVAPQDQDRMNRVWQEQNAAPPQDFSNPS
jgi:hypothetical protein